MGIRITMQNNGPRVIVEEQMVRVVLSTGQRGLKGDKPAHEWDGSRLKIENPDGTWGEAVDLQGLPGLDGTSFVLKGIYPTLNDLCTAHPVGMLGDAYAVGTPIDNSIYIWDVGAQSWVDVGPIQGPPGVKGDDGDPGADGKSIEYDWDGTSLGIRQEGESLYDYVDLKGDDGEPGQDGEDGAPGAPGSDASVTKANIESALGYTPESVLNKGEVSGYASLDATGNVPASQLGNVDGMEEHGNEWHNPAFAEQSDITAHLSANAPHQYGNTFEWRYNSVDDSLDLVVIEE